MSETAEAPVFDILIVDDEQDFAVGLKRILERAFPDCTCLVAHDGEQALAHLSQRRIGVMLTDLRMPGMDGMTLLPKALDIDPLVSVVLLTAYGSIERAVEALKVGAYDFLTKPVDYQDLQRVVEKALERSRLLWENHRLREKVGSGASGSRLVGESAAMTRLKDHLEMVAATDYTVLVLGESGTGKELVARTVHEMSPRANQPWLTVNCPAIPDQLLESELFGHVQGAFTGANREHKGVFLTADKGTLLLDEIGDITPDIQTKLLRVLQEQEIRQVGASKSVSIDVRIVATTNQDLEDKIQDGSFREDLFYRLNVLTVRVPPLRERKEDIPLLAHAFVRQTCQEMGTDPKEIRPEAMSLLSARNWPGNVRELQNFMRKLVVFSGQGPVDHHVVRIVDGGNSQSPEEQRILPYKEAKSQVVDDFTRSYVQAVLRETEGNVSEAARLSGLERVSLQKILRRLDIQAKDFRQPSSS
ncbi:sigma-54-dependent transcriptional regulator [Desulfohalobium retbaense]|uniref:Two component, sigma54 specific, transcriptional regulator, Fis family n=1 Tax=Desulfohalobium retbaense (strain ATCC 49708 / DSM 5692 / JCM 16813 / HR100) TaxID=485915 RepID=C8X1G1_DESRD|nr:sigma-54 dependent transcriptional regulator [Desulfohalobium retbaense]ACV68258.1 two component, sigma54 specific, transcriptional regulator, Fis family [Desulfohalobium retbaense DSM 5692]